MLNALKFAWKKWMEFGKLIGNFMSGVFLTVFYFTVFALFAIPFKLFSRPLASQSPESNWIPKKKTIGELDDFKFEF